MELESLLFSAVLLLGAAAVGVALFKQLGLGSVLGLLVAGIIVGPHAPGPYVTTHVDEVRHFTELGVVLLLFIIGLEMRPARLWALRREVFGLGFLQILISGLLIAAYVLLFLENWQLALLVGLTLALSSTAFVVQLLNERGEMASVHGQGSFAVLLMQDLAIVPLLALVPILSDTGVLSADVPLWKQIGLVLATLVLVFGFGQYLIPKALDYLSRRHNREGFMLVVLLAVLIAAWATDRVGLSMALGGFVMGMLLSQSRYVYQVKAQIEPFKGILMSVFFVAVGMSVELGVLAEDPWLFIQHVTIIVLIKLVVMFGLALVFNFTIESAMRMAVLLGQSGEFGFVLFGAARGLGVIDNQTFVISVAVISVSMLLTPLMVRAVDEWAWRVAAKAGKPIGAPAVQPGEQESGLVIVAGYGRVGHTVATLLRASGIPNLVFDNDPVRVAQGRTDHLPVHFGDVADPALWAAVSAERPMLAVITVDHMPTAIATLKRLRYRYPQLPIIARARDLEAAAKLEEAGATRVFPEVVESSLQLGAVALQMLGIAVGDVEELLQGVRGSDYALVREPAEQPFSGHQDPGPE
jgi:glutathione-regulated potassium-efflux system protein KefB